MCIVNGHISDMEGTIESIVSASEIPLSVIVVGVGEGDGGNGRFLKLEKLDADGEALKDCNGKV